MVCPPGWRTPRRPCPRTTPATPPPVRSVPARRRKAHAAARGSVKPPAGPARPSKGAAWGEHGGATVDPTPYASFRAAWPRRNAAHLSSAKNRTMQRAAALVARTERAGEKIMREAASQGESSEKWSSAPRRRRRDGARIGSGSKQWQRAGGGRRGTRDRRRSHVVGPALRRKTGYERRVRLGVSHSPPAPLNAGEWLTRPTAKASHTPQRGLHRASRCAGQSPHAMVGLQKGRNSNETRANCPAPRDRERRPAHTCFAFKGVTLTSEMCS